ncbi:MAG: hypothetical protein ACFHWZ_05390 [Phycisphaerales bacterium]
MRGRQRASFGGGELREQEQAGGLGDGFGDAAEGEAVGACDAVVGLGVGCRVGEVDLPAFELDG